MRVHFPPPQIEELEVMCADDLLDIDQQTLAKFTASLKVRSWAQLQ
jgi:hypothetical protein